MNIESLIKDNADKLKDSICKIYVTPDIPEKKLNNALASMADNVNPNYVLFIADTSLFGTGKDGMLWVGDRVYVNNNGFKQVFLFTEIKGVEKKEHIEAKSNGDSKTTYKYYLDYNGEKTDITKCLEFINKDGFAELINLIIDELKDNGEGVELESTNQTCPLAMMDSGIKEAYLKIMCNYGLSDNGVIAPNEYAEVMSLIVTNSISQDIRLSIRSYMYDENLKEDDEVLVKYLEEKVDAGSLEALKLSIMKDIINMHWRKMKEYKVDEWKGNDYISHLVSLLGVTDEKMVYIVETIKKNKDILSFRQDDNQIKKSMQDLAAKASAVGVPMAAIYFSGSVLGVSAAGMTSGLAALGMGGVLGFSSMFTGVGVAVLLGVGAYKGVKKVTGMGDLEKNKQREAMLQEIIKNSQISLNYLIEDVNEVTTRLQDAIKQGLENQKKIDKLAGMLSIISKGAQVTCNRVDYAEKEKIICKLPERIKSGFIEDLAPGATKEQIRNYIYEAYSETKTDEEGNSLENCLNTELPSETLRQVYESLKMIGYYNIAENSKAQAVNAAKGFAKGLFG